MRILKVEIVHPSAKLPTKMTPGSAGFDLYAVESVEIPPTRCQPDGRAEVGRALVSIGIKLEIPPRTVGRIASRSGLSIKSNIEVGAGWIDSDYRGELMVEVKNFGSTPYRVNPGDRIAQLVVLPVVDVEARLVPHLTVTERGSSAFGSTDSKHKA